MPIPGKVFGYHCCPKRFSLAVLAVGVLVQFWAFEAIVQISVMGQKQADQKAVVAHSCVLNPVLRFSVEEECSNSNMGGGVGEWGRHPQTRKLMYDYWGRRITRSPRRVKRLAMLWKFTERRSQ